MINNSQNDLISRLGFWSPVLMGVFLIGCGPASVLFASLPWFKFEVIQRLSLIPGFLLTPTFILLMTSIHYYAPKNKKIFSQVGITFAVVFAALLSFSYYLQLTMVHHYSIIGNKQAIEMLSMANPRSLYWILEMLSYGFLGLATLFVAPIFKDRKLENWIRGFMMANGIVSISGLVFYVVNPDITLAIPGLVGYVIWNVVFFTTLVLLSIFFIRTKIDSQE